MLFKYKVTDPEGKMKEGNIEAASLDIAVGALQRRGLIVVSVDPVGEKKGFLEGELFAARVKKKDLVIFSRQLSTLFEAKVPVLSAFKLLSSETDNPALRKVMESVTEEIQSGSYISQAMGKHPKVFSEFYVSMISAGEESGKLDEIFSYLADYLERSYDLASKASRALIYPAFVVVAFVSVMVIMMVVVIPNLTAIIKESGQEAPIYTKIVMGVSDFLLSYGIFILAAFGAGAIFLWNYSRTSAGKATISRLQIELPVFGSLYKKIYLSRVADNMQTLISGGVNMVKSLEITTNTISNKVYKTILEETIRSVKGGTSLSESFGRYEEVPRLFSQMLKIGEESGKLDFILSTLSRFYRKEVDEALETSISMIEPIMIAVLGICVGVLLASVLMPIYNIAMSI